MTISSRTPEGTPNRCPVCGKSIRMEPSIPPGDAPCPSCGSLMWFAQSVFGKDIDLLVHNATITELVATNKPDSIREMVEELSSVQAVESEHEEDIVQSILHREDLGSTGIGNGIAVPHAKHRSVNRLVGAMAISRDGIEFNSLDGQLVHTICLFKSSPVRPNDHLRGLERISQYLRTRSSSPW